jgi:hypothetical protein
MGLSSAYIFGPTNSSVQAGLMWCLSINYRSEGPQGTFTTSLKDTSYTKKMPSFGVV